MKAATKARSAPPGLGAPPSAAPQSRGEAEPALTHGDGAVSARSARRRTASSFASLAGAIRDPWLAGALLVALVVRLVSLDHAPLWFDELTTAGWLTLPWGEMVQSALRDNHPPLYFVVLKAWSEFAGNTVWALRLPSALASWLTVLLIAGSVGALSGRSAARWAAWFAALSPFIVHHGQEARMYAFVTMLAAADLYLLARFVTGATSSLGWLFVGTSCALVACHYYAIFFVAGEIVALLVLWLRPLRSWLPATAGVSIALGAAQLAVLLLARHDAGGDYALGLFAFPGVVWSMVSGYTMLPSSAALHAAGWRAALPYLPVSIPAAAALAVVGAAALRMASRTAAVVLLATIGVTVAGPLVVPLVLPVAINPRYFAAGVPALLALLAMGAPTSPRISARGVATAVLAAILLAGTTRHLSDPGGKREDVSAARVWLDSHVPATEEIVITSSEMASIAQFQWPDRKFRLYPAPGVVAGWGNADGLADAFPFPAGDRAIYVIGREWLSDPDGALRLHLSGRYSSCGGIDLRGIRILCLAKQDADPSAEHGRATATDSSLH